MTHPAKLLFVALALLMAGVVLWYLQRPMAGLLSVGTPPCPPAASQTAADAPRCGEVISSPQGGSSNLVTQLRLFQFDGIRTQWTLVAPRAHSQGEARIIVQKPNLTIYQSDGQTASVTSTQGTLDNHSQVVVFRGQVVATNRHQRLSTDILRFDPKGHILYTERAFVLEDQTMRLEGVGLTLHQGGRALMVSRRVKVVLGPRDGEPREGGPHDGPDLPDATDRGGDAARDTDADAGMSERST